MTSHLPQRAKRSLHSLSRWCKCWVRRGKHFTPSNRSHIESTAGATWQTRELILRRRRGIMAAGRRRAEAGDGSCTRCIQNHIGGDRGSLLLPHSGTSQRISEARSSQRQTQRKHANIHRKWWCGISSIATHTQKKAALVIEACWIWCDSLEWACWLTLACASTGVTSSNHCHLWWSLKQ